MKRKAWMDEWDLYLEVEKRGSVGLVENGLMITQNVDRYSVITGFNLSDTINNLDPEKPESRRINLNDDYKLWFAGRRSNKRYGVTNLEAARIRCNMSVEDLSKVADLHRNIIYRIEKRDRSFNNLRVETALKLANALDCEVEDLFDK